MVVSNAAVIVVPFGRTVLLVILWYQNGSILFV